MAAPTTNKSLNRPANGANVNDWDVPVNENFTFIDTALGGSIVLNPTSLSGVQTLTATQYQPSNLVIGTSLTGQATLTANINYQVPSGVGGQWTVYNNTTGAYTITFSSAGGGTSILLPQGYRTQVVCDGTNVSLSNTSPSGAAGSNTQVQYNSSGYLAGSANLTFNSTGQLSLGGAADTLLALSSSGTANYSFATFKGSGDPVVKVGQYSASAAGTTFGLNNTNLAVVQTTTTATSHPSALAIGNVGSIPIVFATNGSERFRIDSSGNAGLGTDTPTNTSNYSTLTINGTYGGQIVFASGGTPKQYVYSTSSDFIISNQPAGNIRFETSATERMRITSSGNVGIGTATPNRTLDVYGDMGCANGYGTAFFANYYKSAADSNYYMNPYGTSIVDDINFSGGYLLSKLADFSNTYSGATTSGGYQKMPGGMIMQWGISAASVPQSGQYNIVFPVAFPTDCRSVVVTRIDTVTTNSFDVSVGFVSASGFTYLNNGAHDGAFYWMAIGY